MSDLFDQLEPAPALLAFLNKDPLARAREIILAEAARRGTDEILGAVLLVKSNLGVSYCDAAAMLRDLVSEGFVTEADHDGRRKVLGLKA